MQIVDSMLAHLHVEHPETLAYFKDVAEEAYIAVGKRDPENGDLHVHGDAAFDDAVALAYKRIGMLACSQANDLLGQCFHLGLVLAMAAIAPEVEAVIHRDQTITDPVYDYASIQPTDLEIAGARKLKERFPVLTQDYDAELLAGIAHFIWAYAEDHKADA